MRENLTKEEAGIHTQTCYRWRKEYGGLKLDQAKRLKELEKENTRLKRLVAELSLEKQVLQEVAEGNFSARSGGIVRWSGHGGSMACRNGTPAGCWGNGGERNDTSRFHRLDEDDLTRAVVALAAQYGRYGYRRITA